MIESIPCTFSRYRLLSLGSRYRSFLFVGCAHLLDNYEEALRCTVESMGDLDTTCAFVDGIVALSVQGIPAAWLARREPLPEL